MYCIMFYESDMGWHQVSGWRSVFAVACARPATKKNHGSMGVVAQRLKEYSDEQLMEAYRDGNVQAFDQLFMRYRDMLYRYFLRQCANAAFAEELFQEVWASLIRHHRSYKVTARFRTYLFHIAHNKLIDHYRSHSRYDAVSYEEAEHAPAEAPDAMNQPDHHADVMSKVARLLVQIEKLPAAQRDVFLLHEEAGMSLGEIAEVMKVSRDTAKSRLRYALQRLRRGMERYS